MTSKTLQLLFLTVVFAGCGRSHSDAPDQQKEHMTPTSGKNQHVLGIVIDVSDSFKQQLEREDGAFDYVLKVIKAYTRAYPADDGRLVISHIGRTDKGLPALVWEGKPSHLRRSFKTADDFKEFVLKKTSDTVVMTPLYESLGDTVEYVLSHATVQSGRSSADLIIISDMVDTVDVTGQQRQRVTHLLQRFCTRGSNVGVYFADISTTPTVTQLLTQAGYDNPTFSTSIDPFPPVPTFRR